MTPKSETIVHEARQELMSFISFEAQSIVKHRIYLGKEKHIDRVEAGFYEINLIDYDVAPVSVTISVWNTWDVESYNETRQVKKILLDSVDNEVYVFLDGMNWDDEDPLYIRSFSTDDIKDIGCVLEEIYDELNKTAPVL